MITVFQRSFEAPAFDMCEMLRYANCNDCKEEFRLPIRETVDLAKNVFSYKVCYAVMPFSCDRDICDFDAFKVRSEKLAKNLSGCRSVLLFGATVGIEIDRLIAKYSRISPTKALLLQAYGAERIEALCNEFCKCYESENSVGLRPRFSAGYGDCPLETQKDIFSLLECSRRIGLTLNDSCLMSPTKSVTAFAGIKEK